MLETSRKATIHRDFEYRLAFRQLQSAIHRDQWTRRRYLERTGQ